MDTLLLTVPVQYLPLSMAGGTISLQFFGLRTPVVGFNNGSVSVAVQGAFYADNTGDGDEIPLPNDKVMAVSSIAIPFRWPSAPLVVEVVPTVNGFSMDFLPPLFPNSPVGAAGITIDIAVFESKAPCPASQGRVFTWSAPLMSFSPSPTVPGGFNFSAAPVLIPGTSYKVVVIASSVYGTSNSSACMPFSTIPSTSPYVSLTAPAPGAALVYPGSSLVNWPLLVPWTFGYLPPTAPVVVSLTDSLGNRLLTKQAQVGSRSAGLLLTGNSTLLGTTALRIDVVGVTPAVFSAIPVTVVAMHKIPAVTNVTIASNETSAFETSSGMVVVVSPFTLVGADGAPIDVSLSASISSVPHPSPVVAGSGMIVAGVKSHPVLLTVSSRNSRVVFVKPVTLGVPLSNIAAQEPAGADVLLPSCSCLVASGNAVGWVSLASASASAWTAVGASAGGTVDLSTCIGQIGVTDTSLYAVAELQVVNPRRSTSSGSSLSGGDIAAIVVCTLLAVAAIVSAAAFVLIRKRRSRIRSSSSEDVCGSELSSRLLEGVSFPTKMEVLPRQYGRD